MSLSATGTDLRYAFELARATNPTKFLKFPVVPIAMTQTDRLGMARNLNLAGASRVSYIRGLAPDVAFQWDNLTIDQVETFRAYPLSFTDVYILRIPRLENFLAQDSIAYLLAGTRYCNLLESSYTLASKRSVDNGGPSLLDSFSVRDTWVFQMAGVPPGFFEHFQSYDDTNQRVVLSAANPPAAGARVFVKYNATAWLARPRELSWAPIPGRSDLFTAQLAFEAV